jgi:hypothetical protein
MKQKLVITIIVTVFVSAFFSILVVKLTFGSAKARQQQVDVVPVITSDFPSPSPQDFNSSSIDPTQLIQIGTSTNPVPFNTSSPQQ